MLREIYSAAASQVNASVKVLGALGRDCRALIGARTRQTIVEGAASQRSLRRRKRNDAHAAGHSRGVSLSRDLSSSGDTSPSQRLMTTVATPLPTRLVSARHSLMKRSMPTSRASDWMGMLGIV